MSRRVLLAVLVMCWRSALHAGDFTMPGNRGRIRPPGLLKGIQVLARGIRTSTKDRFGSEYPAAFINNAIEPPPVMPVNEFSGGFIYALPMFMNRTATLTFMQAYIGGFGGTGEVCRLAVYDSVSATDLYPKNKLFQSGADFPVDGVTVGAGNCGSGAVVPCGLQETPNVLMKSDTIYWFCLWCNAVASPAPQPNYIPIAAAWNFAGLGGVSFANAYRLQLAYTGTFPAAWPGGFTGGFCGISGSCAPITLNKLPIITGAFD